MHKLIRTYAGNLFMLLIFVVLWRYSELNNLVIQPKVHGHTCFAGIAAIFCCTVAGFSCVSVCVGVWGSFVYARGRGVKLSQSSEFFIFSSRVFCRAVVLLFVV